ncbi:MAG TPA: GAF domain-containing protein [Candidatus Binatia bacterium]|nr:GAF domain-containing protein [Candidatus Binatia bacterium]
MDGSGHERPAERRARQLAAVIELIKTVTSTLELPEILRIVLDRIKTLTRAEALSLLLYDAERDELVFAATETLQENLVTHLRVPPEHGVASWVACTGESAVVNDVANDPRFYAAIDRISRFRTKSLLVVPVKRAGAVLGVLELANRYEGVVFGDDDRAALERLAADVGAHLDPAALPHDPDAMRALLARVAATVPSEAAALLLRDDTGRDLVFTASRTLRSGVIDGLRMPTDRGIAGWVARHREAVRVTDVTKDPRYWSGIEQQTHFTPHAMLCVPMLAKGRLLGVIQLINKLDGTTFDEDELYLTQMLADHAAIAIENASLYHQALLASITDDLTGLGNTRHFNRTLPELLRRGGPVALLVLDLDSFKQVVDTHGHLVGSRTIGRVGRLIAGVLRPGDVAARFGGDEFVVVLPSTDGASALAIAETIRAAIEAERRLDGEVDISAVTASVGVAVYPEHAGDAEGLFRAADAAMYAVKRGPKNAVALARPSGSAAA